MSVERTRFQRWISPALTRLAAGIFIDRRLAAAKIKVIAEGLEEGHRGRFKEILRQEKVIKRNVPIGSLEHYHLSLIIYYGKLIRAANRFKEESGIDLLSSLVYLENDHSSALDSLFSGVTDYERELVANTREDVLAALKRRGHQLEVKFDRVVDEAIALAMETNPSIPVEQLLYRARKMTDLGGNVIAVTVVLLQDIPLERLARIMGERTTGELYKLRKSIVKVLKRSQQLERFSLKLEKMSSPDYLERKMKRLVRGCRYYETFLLLYFNKLQKARNARNPNDPVFDDVQLLFAPLAERVQLIFLADDLRDQYMRGKRPGKHEEVMQMKKRRIGWDDDEAKRQLRIFVGRLQEQINREHPGKLAGMTRILWRVKSVFSVWNKVEVRRRCTYGNINDILGVKMIFRTKEELREVVEIIRKMFRVAVHDIDDNLDAPRESGYQGLNMVVHDPQGKPIEIQFMTAEMNYDNIFMRAATWLYNLMKDLEECGFRQVFDETVIGMMVSDPETNFYRLYHHWAKEDKEIPAPDAGVEPQALSDA